MPAAPARDYPFARRSALGRFYTDLRVPGWFKPEYAWLLLVTFLWGSGHTAGKIALRELDAAQLALLRPASAWLVLVALVLVTGRTNAAWPASRSPR
jgi:hypothetical protein